MGMEGMGVFYIWACFLSLIDAYFIVSGFAHLFDGPSKLPSMFAFSTLYFVVYLMTLTRDELDSFRIQPIVSAMQSMEHKVSSRCSCMAKQTFVFCLSIPSLFGCWRRSFRSYAWPFWAGLFWMGAFFDGL